MIAFFPDAYPDELLYSRICRYHVRSGNFCIAFTFDDIYAHRTVHPDMEFLNRYTEEALNWICGDGDLQAVIMTQTMYPFYARFLPKERRNNALTSLVSQEGNWYNLLRVPQTGTRFLRYCPACAEEDRAQYGETYWHRAHQIQRIRVCYKHGCFFKNSAIRIASKTKPSLFDAESNVPSDSPAEVCRNEREIDFVRYLVAVGEQPIDLETEQPIGLFLHGKLDGYYSGKSRLVVAIDRLYADYFAFYGDMEKANLTVFQKILNDYNHDPYYVLTIAFFLRISVAEITSLPKQIEIHGIDRLYAQLSEKYGIEYRTVSEIGAEVLRFSHRHSYVQRRCGVRSKDWARLDDELLPKVQTAVSEIINAEGRPVKLSVAMIQKKLGLPQKQLDMLPNCKQYIVEHMETQPAFWAREIEWLVQTLEEQRVTITKTKIKQTLNLRQNDLIISLGFIKDTHVNGILSRLLKEE